MESNAKMLDYLYQNTQMGVNTIEQLLKIVDDKDFQKHLESQLNEYKSISNRTIEICKRLGHDEKGIGTVGEISTYMMINMKTLLDKTPSHVSEMMINGSTMGIIQATKALKNYKDADDEIVGLMEKLIKTEEKNFQQLKRFL